MAAPLRTLICRRASRALLVSLVILSAILSSCQQEDVEHARQIESLKTDLDQARRRLNHVHKSFAAKEDELLVVKMALEAAQNRLAEKDQAITERDAALRTAQAELDALKKRDAFVFVEIRTLQQQGQSTLALSRYQKFIKDFPKSPLVGSATNAIAELTTSLSGGPPREARPTTPPPATPDPKRREREILKHFNEGYVTLPELAPLLKKKSLPEVLALLGKPNQTFNEGTEIGYAEKAINPATGLRGMLVIGFESRTVDTLRVEYGGRKMTP